MAGSGSGLDAFITFGQGTAGSKILDPIEGETGDVFEQGFKSSQLTDYTFSFAHGNDPSEATGTSEQSGPSQIPPPTFQPLSITKSVDTASPDLFKAMCLGAIFDNIWIWQKKPGASMGKSGDYFLKIQIDNVHIDQLTWTANDGDPAPKETLQLTYRALWIDYIPQMRTGALNKSGTKSNDYTLPAKTPQSQSNNPQADDVARRVLTLLQQSGVHIGNALQKLGSGGRPPRS